MPAKKSELWLTLSWNDERLQSLRLDVPRPVWLGEAADLLVPQAAIGAERLLVVTAAAGAWLLPDGRPLPRDEAQTRQFGDFTVQFVLTAREPRHLPLAWPQELAQLGLALALAVGLVALPLWLGGQQTRRYLRMSVTDQALAAIVPLPVFIADQTADAPPPADPPPEPQHRTVWFPDERIVADPVVTAKVEPAPQPPPNADKPANPPPAPRRSTTRVAEPDPGAILRNVVVADPTAPRRPLFGDPSGSDLPTRNGTDVPHVADLAGRSPRPALPDAPQVGEHGPRKVASDRDLDLTPGQQDVVQVRSPRALVEGNGLDAETVHAYIQRMHGQMRHCLELGMLGSAKLNGRVRVAFVIAPDGAVLQARVEESALHAPETEDCIVERIRGWQFPAAATGLPTRVRHGFVFHTK